MKRKIRHGLTVMVLCLLIATSLASAAQVSLLSKGQNNVASPVADQEKQDADQKNINENILSKVCYFQHPELKKIKVAGTLYDEITMPDDLQNVGDPGEPLLPVKDLTFMLPYGTEVDKIQIIQGEKILVGTGYTLRPGREPVLSSDDNPISTLIPNKEIYGSSEPFPHDSFISSGTQYFRGIPLVSIAVYPVQYVPATGTLSYFPIMTIEIFIKKSNTPSALLRNFEEDIGAAQDKVCNPSAAQTYRDASVSSGSTRDYNLLIITTDTLKPGFQRLVQAHNLEGMRTIVKTLRTDIPVGDTANQTCENVRNYIRTMYMRYGIDYVLIGGDIDVIPAAYLLGFVPSDFYYACLDGPYNIDNDSSWGENHDGYNHGEVDLIAEVYVGRASVGNLTEVGHFVNKTLHYMKLKPSSTSNQDSSNPYLKRIVMAGEKLFGEVDDPANLTFGEDYIEEQINGSSRRGYTTVGIPYHEYNIDRLYDSSCGYPPGWPASVLIGKINNGTHIINHLGHSGNFYNMRMYIDEVDALTNDLPCFIYSQGCDAGAFDQDAYQRTDCIAEHFTIKTEHGAFAGIWNARLGFADVSNRVARYFWDAVFHDGITVISKANQISKEKNVWLLHTDPGMRYHCYQLNFFGDPAISFNFVLHVDAHGPYHGILGNSIRFTGVVVGGRSPYKWEWMFGDGTSSKERSPLKQYQHTGTYQVTIKVTDASGKIDINTTTVTIAEKIRADAHGPYMGVVDVPVLFSGSATGGFSPYHYHWMFGTGDTADGQQTSYTYTTTGSYLVTLLVTDRYGNSKSENTTATIYQQPSSVWVDDDFNQSTPGWWYDHFAHIPDALTAVTEGGTIFVAPGTYDDELVIEKPVSILGSGATQTTIESQYYNPSVTLQSDGVTISGFTIHHDGNLAIRCISNGNSITDNTLDNLLLEGCAFTSVCRNTFSSDGIILYGRELSQWNTLTIEDNIVNGKPVYYYKDNTGPLTAPSDAGQVILANCSNVLLSGLTIDNVIYGIQVGFSSGNQIVHNIISLAPSYSYSSIGIYLSHSTNNRIEENTISYGNDGMVIGDQSNDNILVGNILENNGYDGVFVSSSDNNSFIENTISGSCNAIELYESSRITISHNKIHDNWDDALYIWNGERISIDHNELTNNSRYGVHAYDVTHMNVTGNTMTGSSGGVCVRDFSYDTLIAGNSLGPIYVDRVFRTTIRDNVISSDGITIFGDMLGQWNTHTMENNTLYGKQIYYLANNNAPMTITTDAAQIILANCSNITLQDTTIANAWKGLQVGFCSHNTFMNNTVTQNSYGMVFFESDDNLLSHNSIIENQGNGLYLEKSSGNTIVENTFRYNGEYGLNIRWESINNRIYHNNFIDNWLGNAYALDSNIWNQSYPSGGNYWSDYDGNDLHSGPGQNEPGADGIGDSSIYVYDFGDQDFYPFISENGWQ